MVSGCFGLAATWLTQSKTGESAIIESVGILDIAVPNEGNRGGHARTSLGDSLKFISLL
jgi:hypothetical protein